MPEIGLLRSPRMTPLRSLLVTGARRFATCGHSPKEHRRLLSPPFIEATKAESNNYETKTKTCISESSPDRRSLGASAMASV